MTVNAIIGLAAPFSTALYRNARAVDERKLIFVQRSTASLWLVTARVRGRNMPGTWEILEALCVGVAQIVLTFALGFAGRLAAQKSSQNAD